MPFTPATLRSYVDANIEDNASQQVTPADVRNSFKVAADVMDTVYPDGTAVGAAATAVAAASAAGASADAAAADRASISSTYWGVNTIISSKVYGTAGDGVSDDSSEMETFLEAVDVASFGVIPPGDYRLAGVVADGYVETMVRGSPGATLERTAAGVNMVTLNAPQRSEIGGFAIDGRYAVTGNNGHGLVLIDPNKVVIDRLSTKDLGGGIATNGGAGVLAYPTVVANFLPEVRISKSRFSGNSSDKSFGVILDSVRFGSIIECHAENMSLWGLELKNEAEFSIVAVSTGEFCTYSFGIGYEGTPNGQNNIFGLLASKNSDQALNISRGTNNLVVGLNAHTDSQPNHFGDNKAYTLHLETEAHENLAIGILASGAVVDYPVRIRGDRNVVQLADYSDAAKTVTFNNGAVENYVEVLHIGEKAETVTGLIEDQNSPFIPKGVGANVIDSPLTREYFGSIRNGFTWGVDGYSNAYVHYSTTGFMFEGYQGRTILGLGVKSSMEAGLSVSTEAAAGQGTMLYVNAATPYWSIGAAGAAVVRVDALKIAPVTPSAVTLGNSGSPFGDAFIGMLRTKLETTAPAMVNDTLTFVKVSNTQIKMQFKGSDGVNRNCTLNFS